MCACQLAARTVEAQNDGGGDIVIGGGNRTDPSTEQILEAAAMIGGFAAACLCICCGAPLAAIVFVSLICAAEKAKKARRDKEFMARPQEGGPTLGALQMRSNPAVAVKVAG